MKPSKDTAWLRDFQELLNRPAEKLPPGEGWATIDEICAACGKNQRNNKVTAMVAGLVAAGKYERFTGTKYDPAKKQSFRQVWYRPCASNSRANRTVRQAP